MIIDTPNSTTSKISCLRSQGVQTVIRYYNFSNSQAFPHKRLELAEAEALAAAGLKMAVTFQQRQNQAGDFDELKGFAAGRQAFRHAQHSIGQPTGSGIYFSVDFDAGASEINTHVIPFFRGVRRAFDEESGGQPSYRVGVYGSGLVSRTLRDEGLIELTWLAMSRGFRGTKQALEAGQFDIAQRAPEAKLCGIDVDFNDANPDGRDFGAFTIQADVVTAPPADVITASGISTGAAVSAGERHRVIARGGLRLREGPGTQFDIIGGLPFGQIVTVVSVVDGFARIDVEGDGQIDGFASAGFLERV